MANRDIVTRSGKGASLSATDHDQNINGLHGTVEQQTGTTYTVVYTDQGKTIELNNASMVCTLDSIATISAAIDTDNFLVRIKNVNAADATVQRSGTDTINGATSITISQNETVTLQTDSTGGIWTLANPVTRNGTETLSNKTLESPVLNTQVTGTAVKDEDDMASDSAVHLATQQSIKAYSDSRFIILASPTVLTSSIPTLGTWITITAQAGAKAAVIKVNAYSSTTGSGITVTVSLNIYARVNGSSLSTGTQTQIVRNANRNDYSGGTHTSLTRTNTEFTIPLDSAGRFQYYVSGSTLSDFALTLVGYYQ